METDSMTVLSKAQKGVYLETTAFPDRTTYNLPYLCELKKNVDIKKLKKAIELLISIHPCLNSEIVSDETGEIYMKTPAGANVLEYRMSDSEFEERQKRLVRPFRMNGECLSRFEIYLTESAEYLFYDFHHVAADGYSLKLFKDELLAAYNGQSIAREKYTACEYAEEEQSLIGEEAYTETQQYWAELLAPFDTDCLPPADNKLEKPVQKWYEKEFSVDMEDLDAVRSRAGASTSAVFTSAFGLVIAKYNGADTSVISTVFSGRDDSRIANTVGMFVKTFPFVTDLTHTADTAEFVHAASDQLKKSRENLLVSLVDLSEKYTLKNDINFAFHGRYFNQCAEEKQIFSYRTRIYDSAHIEETKLLVEVCDLSDGNFSLHIGFREDMFSEAFAESIANAYICALRGILKEPDLHRISLVDEKEIRRLEQFNENEKAFDNEPVVSQFRRMAEMYPDQTAVVCGTERLTYRELDALSERIGAYCKSLGLGAEDVVGVMVPRCVHITSAALGAQKAGCCYQPLDSSYPKERLQFMLEDSGAKLLITSRKLIELVPEYKGYVLFTEDFAALPPAEILNVVPKPHDRFILLYTSGTTGMPKGVQLEQINLSAFCAWYRSFYRISCKSRVAAYASFAFDASMMDLYGALTSGAVLYIIEEEMRLDFISLDRYMCDNAITDVFMTTQIGREFAQLTTCQTLKQITVGGEKLVPLKPESRPFKFYNGYGPSECTIFSTIYEVDRFYDRVPIGKVLDNFRGYVVDRYGNRLPTGACGELWLAGPQVGRGYLNRPEKTKDSFIDNPFCTAEDYKKAYRTGDIVRYKCNGVLDFIGRRDTQVKVRGFRIELTEVEEVVRRFPGIKDATVTAFDDPNGGNAIAAYIVSDDRVDMDALRAFILAEKPPYLVPAVIMQIDEIPYNQNQKVNKKALPKPEAGMQAEKMIKTAPLNRLEVEIAKLIEEVLHIDVKNVTENFSLLGLTSISSIRLATLIYKKFGVQMEARKLVSDGNLQYVENIVLEHLMLSEAVTDRHMIADAEEKKWTYLGFEQQGVYADCMLDPHSTRYNMPFSIKLPEDVSAEELTSAVLTLAAMHSALRSHFVHDQSGEAVMELVEDYVPEVPVREMTQKELLSYKKEFVRPFNLQEVPARYEIIRSGSLYLFFDIHHLIADGSSIDLFISQLCSILDQEDVESEELSYFNYVSSQSLSEEDDDFFAQQMGRMEEPSQLLPDIYENNLPHTEGNVYVQTNLDAIAEFAEENGVTPASIGLAAVQLVVSRYLAENAVALATISGGRSNLDIADTVGMFVNTLAITAAIDNAQSVPDYIKETADNFNAVIAHEHYPFARLSAKFDFKPHISYAWQVGTMTAHTTHGKTVEKEELATGSAKNPVSTFFEETAEGGIIRVAYDESMYTKAMMRGFAMSINRVVEELLVKTNLHEISLTGEDEWKILDSFNRPLDLGFDPHDTVVSRFRHSVNTHPDKTAAVFKEKAYTYRELDELTDRLAAVIYDRVRTTVGKDSLAECVVSILSERNENAFIMPLAVIKAGCAYEPLDPSYPQDRLNFMISDADACLLIAQDDICGLLSEYKGDRILFSELYAAEPMEKPAVTIDPKDLFIMLYTSGSTGVPKGVQIEHRNMIAFAHGIQLENFYAEHSVTAAYASFGFDVNMADTFCTLLNGGSVHLIPEEIRMNLDDLAKYFDDNAVTDIMMTTQVGVQFIQNYPNLKTMRSVMMGGEKLPAVHPEKLSYTIINGYGPTENCCGVSVFPIRCWEPNIPIGKPFATINGYVLDKTGHRLPAGAAGEYCLSGPQVSRGYLHRPDKTAEAYEDCPFDNYRMYHTGDIVRYRQNGDVEFVGRKDGQVKIRGFRVETKEVEAVIHEFSGIKDVTVQAYDYESGGKYLAAFVVCEGELNSEELAVFIKSRKPAYMVPAVFMQLDRIPLTVNQKVDKKALPKPQVKKAEYVRPETKEEEDFCHIFEQVLGVEKAGAEDDFFEIGGSSISAMKVVLSASELGYAIVYQNVFDCPTPRLLAQLAGSTETVSAVDEFTEVEKSQYSTPYGSYTKEVDPEGFDYTKINALLRNNTFETFRKGEKQELGDILLLGATGYLGSHVLHELLMHESGKIICLVRPGKGVSAEERLMSTYEAYFGKDAKHFMDGRVQVRACDGIDEKSLEQITERHLTVINCAASVKHFAKNNEIEKVNVGTVNSLIAWCLTQDSRLVHISTESVMGSSCGQFPAAGFRFTETVLYAGQRYEDNQYIRSKFLGERAIYEAILNDGLNARVIRVGNLAPRMDGQFQLNYDTNSFMKSLAAYQTMGMIAYSPCASSGEENAPIDMLVEFSPIEKVAEAVRLLAKAPRECVCFAASNNHLVHFGDVVMALSSKEHPINLVDGETFSAELKRCLENPEKASRVSELVAYASGEAGVKELGYEMVDNSVTMTALYDDGFMWPETGKDYVLRFADKLRESGFFM